MLKRNQEGSGITAAFALEFFRIILLHPRFTLYFLSAMRGSSKEKESRRRFFAWVAGIAMASELLNVPVDLFISFLSELKRLEQEKFLPLITSHSDSPAMVTNFSVAVLYGVVRRKKPDVIVETGVANGRSSAVILAALKHNGHGALYSIDLGLRQNEGGYISLGKEPGHLVPPPLRDRWHLILGDVRIELPSLLQKLGAVDLFHHDSDHSYSHMKWEFETVFPYLKRGGVLLSDDVNQNMAFREFAQAMKGRHRAWLGSGGCVNSTQAIT